MNKSPENDSIRLRHMLDAAQKAVQFAESESRESLTQNEQLQFALVRAIEIVGEAANQITDDFQAKHPEIAWRDIIGMRNRIIHAYFEVDLDVVWNTVTENLPPLIATLQAILDNNNHESDAK